MYVGPQMVERGERMQKPELKGETKEDAGVIIEVVGLGYSGVRDENDAMSPELDHQTRRRGVADAELEGRAWQRRAAELEAARTNG